MKKIWYNIGIIKKGKKAHKIKEKKMNVDYVVEIKEGIHYVPIRIKKLIRSYASDMGVATVHYRYRPLGSHDWRYVTVEL